MKEKRIETIAELENALEGIESGEGLSTFVEGHGLNSHRFRGDCGIFDEGAGRGKPRIESSLRLDPLSEEWIGKAP